jgi:hypothetical protein
MLIIVDAAAGSMPTIVLKKLAPHNDTHHSIATPSSKISQYAQKAVGSLRGLLWDDADWVTVGSGMEIR